MKNQQKIINNRLFNNREFKLFEVQGSSSACVCVKWIVDPKKREMMNSGDTVVQQQHDYGYELECIERDILISEARFLRAAFEQQRYVFACLGWTLYGGH